jgi:glucosamine--fructose-6-phosphate aminotransferase (isomerizing)
MCGIVGYVGPRPSQDILLSGLARLEYRGYDSAGIAIIDGDGHLGLRKHAGKLQVLRDDLAAHPLADGTTGIGHTR